MKSACLSGCMALVMVSAIMIAKERQLLFDFSGADAVKEWQTINAGVMAASPRESSRSPMRKPWSSSARCRWRTTAALRRFGLTVRGFTDHVRLRMPMVCGSGIQTTTSRSHQAAIVIPDSHQIPQIMGENAGSIRLSIVSLSLASELHE